MPPEEKPTFQSKIPHCKAYTFALFKNKVY